MSISHPLTQGADWGQGADSEGGKRLIDISPYYSSSPIRLWHSNMLVYIRPTVCITIILLAETRRTFCRPLYSTIKAHSNRGCALSSVACVRRRPRANFFLACRSPLARSPSDVLINTMEETAFGDHILSFIVSGRGRRRRLRSLPFPFPMSLRPGLPG